MLISAGPLFTFTPAVSFLVACKSKGEVDHLWNELHESGKELMPLAKYPFSERYGWTEDKYGLSWQLMYIGDQKMEQRITPTMMFVGDQCGKAEEAMQFYTSIFHDSAITDITRYGPHAEPNKENMVMHGAFMLENQGFASMDSAYEHAFTFNEAISFMVYCDSQKEIDYYWDSLTAYPEAEQCGWLKDKYGFSGQIVPRIMETMMQEKNPEKLSRITKAFLNMKKFDVAELEKASY